MLLKRIILFFSLFAYSFQTFIPPPPFIFSNLNKNNLNKKQKIKQDYDVNNNINKNNTISRKLNRDDIVTLMQIWCTLLVFTFPFVFYPSKNY